MVRTPCFTEVCILCSRAGTLLIVAPNSKLISLHPVLLLSFFFFLMLFPRMWLSAFQKAEPLSASFSLPIPYITCLIQSWEWLIFLLQTHVHTMSCLPSNGPSQILICRVMTVFCCRCPVPICRGQSLSVSGFILFWMLLKLWKWKQMIYLIYLFFFPPSLANFVSIIYCGKVMPNKQSMHFILRLIFILACYRSELEPMSVKICTPLTLPLLFAQFIKMYFKWVFLTVRWNFWWDRVTEI